ncbi:hypothetical protein [Falsiroseomonas stagni]|uniref:Uncharacterized protein n=1 Tax=Falsiroseomonas stagni DSM 19981 TaxID=1123062 RepID=A0A1I4E3R6_9PROT|nr:hypothetical protein [Falsiroseomonas stagni]SFK98811.1 hypothetical protein SAMN02745775_11368 [Falsiroseomonas stagni DSM 19981]
MSREPPRSLRAIEQPAEIDRLLALWGKAFDEKSIPARQRPRLKPMGPGRREGFTQWGAKVGGMEMNISLEEVTANRWRIDHGNQGALAMLDGQPVLLRQWYVKRAPTDASLTAAEIAQVSEEPPFYVTPGVHRGTPTERRLYQIVAMPEADPVAVREQTAAAIARHAAALEKFGFA